MDGWWAILLVVGLGAAGLYLCVKERARLLDEGKILDRPRDFVRQAQEFTLTLPDEARVTEGVQGFDYKRLGVSMKGSDQQQSFRFAGPDWSASLRRLSREGQTSVYRFEFTGWRSSGGVPTRALQMNMLLTAVETLLLSIDPHTRVRGCPVELHTKHSFL